MGRRLQPMGGTLAVLLYPLRYKGRQSVAGPSVNSTYHPDLELCVMLSPFSSWLSSSGLPLDILVCAGGRQIPTNKTVLASTSGYFQAVLDNGSSPMCTLTLPTIPPDIFCRLLGCMYTGRLDATNDTIYQLAWYAQMLQIPSAVLQCKQFLATKPATPPVTKPAAVKIVRPIASRPLLPLAPFPSISYSDILFNYTRVQQSSATAETPEPVPLPRTDIKTPVEEDKESSQEKENLSSPRLASFHSLLDTASCDGPVKFHRIVNRYFTVDGEPKENKDSVDDDQEKVVPFCTETVKLSKANNMGIQSVLKKAMLEETGSGEETYTCIYCNHIFKSHYCYQKHKRRHINPVTVDLHSSSSENKPMVMKDLNVQYFPCKICGAKFPSYYFVHKHKKCGTAIS